MLLWLRRNLDSVLLSLGLAVLLWYVATIEQARPTLRRINPGPPIEVRNRPPNLALEEPVEQRVELTVRLPAAEEVSAEDFQAWVDLEGLEPGTHALPVRVECARCAQDFIQIASYDPREITFSLEAHKQTTFTVQAVPGGTVAPGYAAGPIQASPPEVTVSGPASLVERVDRVEAHFSIQGLRQSLEQTVDVQPVDEQGQAVAGLTVSPEEVQVLVPVRLKPGFRDVAVSPDTVGNVAEGYLVTNVTIEPPVVTVSGPTEVIDNMAGVLQTEPVSIEGATETVEERVELLLPPGVQLVGVHTVEVTIEVDPIQGGISLQVPVEFRGLERGLVASASPETVQVFLSGPLPLLQELAEDPGDVRVVVDLQQRQPGTYILQPDVETPDELAVESALPGRVEVVIEEALTPTPEGG